MIDLLCLLVLNSLAIIGIHNATYYELERSIKHIRDAVHSKGLKEIETFHPTNKRILWFIPYYTQWLPEIIRTPLYECIKCMASVHGFYVFWIYIGEFSSLFVLIYIFYTFALSGLNTIIYEYIFDK